MARLPRRLRAPSSTENPQESGRNWRNNNERVQDPATKMSDAFWDAHNALCGAIRAPLPFSTPSKGARLLLPRVDKRRRKGGEEEKRTRRDDEQAALLPLSRPLGGRERFDRCSPPPLVSVSRVISSNCGCGWNSCDANALCNSNTTADLNTVSSFPERGIHAAV